MNINDLIIYFGYDYVLNMLNDKIEALEKEKETILDYVESLNKELEALKAEKGGK